MTIPNILTLLRIFLTPLLIWLLIENRLNEAFVVFVVAGLTDGLDGFIARVFHQKSKLGAFLDPLADKLLLVGSFIMLGYLGLVPDWLAILVVSRDGVILLGLATLFFHHVEVEIRPVPVSKITTFMQLVTVFLCLGCGFLKLPAWGSRTVFGATALLTVASGLHYLYIGFSLLGNGRRKNGRNGTV